MSWVMTVVKLAAWEGGGARRATAVLSNKTHAESLWATVELIKPQCSGEGWQGKKGAGMVWVAALHVMMGFGWSLQGSSFKPTIAKAAEAHMSSRPSRGPGSHAQSTPLFCNQRELTAWTSA